MIKQLFIPLHVSEQATGELLELYVQPRLTEANDIFSGLIGAGLEPGIKRAKQLLQLLALKTGNGTIYCVNSQPPLVNPESTALGLMLMSLLSRPGCAYQTLIVCAGIADDAALTLESTRHWQEKLAAILTLGKQAIEVPLILSADCNSELSESDIQQLKSCNITAYRLANVKQVLDLIMPS